MTKRTFSMIAASVVVATGPLLGSDADFSPGGRDNGIDVAEIVVPKGMPSFDDTYQRYTGVLDTLN